MYDICPEDKPETYTCPICGAGYRMCDEPTCRHSDEEWSEYLDHEEAMELDWIGEREG
jgi:hypothetical protein